jgi:DnaK suppressor protein
LAGLLQPFVFCTGLAMFFFQSYYVSIKKTACQKENTMREQDIDLFKKILTEQLESLLGQGNITIRGLITDREHLPDPLDQASFELEHGTMLRIKDRESKLIRKIQSALENLKSGDFGICETCGEEIGIERLKARPVTAQCIQCKTRSEALER